MCDIMAAWMIPWTDIDIRQIVSQSIFVNHGYSFSLIDPPFFGFPRKLDTTVDSPEF